MKFYFNQNIHNPFELCLHILFAVGVTVKKCDLVTIKSSNHLNFVNWKIKSNSF